MIYVTGDTHGNQYKWIEQIDTVLNAEDTILVCGDFGIGFWNGRYWSEEMFFDYLSEQKYTILFVDGNHENFEKLNSYPEDMQSTSCRDILPMRYFKGLYNMGEVPENFKYRYSMLKLLVVDGYDRWKNFSAVYDINWNGF